MKFTIFNSAMETSVSPSNQKDLAWEQIVPNMMKPRVALSKTDVKMFVGASFKEDGKRCSDDLLEYSMLTLDYDKGVHYNWFISTFLKYEFVLYTSWSNTTDECRYRVVLPLSEPITADDLRKLKPELSKMFSDADEASFSVSQAFYLPSCSEEKKSLFFSRHNKGQMFNTEELWVQASIREAQQFIKKAGEQPVNFDENLTPPMEEAVKWLKATSPDLGYYEWLKVGSCLKYLYGEAAEDLWIKWSQEGSKCDQHERSLISKWNGLRDDFEYSFGFLVNQSRRFPNV